MTFPLITEPYFYAVAIPAVLLPAAPIGVWLGGHIARRINQVLFFRLVHLGMFLTGVKLLCDAIG